MNTTGIPVGPPERFVRLAPGQAEGLSVSSQALGVPFGQRVQLRLVVVPPGPGDTGGGCVATAELVDQASRFTTTLIPAGTPVTIPPGPNDVGMMGLAHFQTLRLNVVAYPPTPCDATLSFADATGTAVGPSQRATLRL